MRPLLALLLLVAPVQLSESDKVRAELHQNKVALLSCQEQLVSAQVQLQKTALSDEQRQLEATFRERMHPADGELFDWSSLTWKPPAK